MKVEAAEKVEFLSPAPHGGVCFSVETRACRGSGGGSSPVFTGISKPDQPIPVHGGPHGDGAFHRVVADEQQQADSGGGYFKDPEWSHEGGLPFFLMAGSTLTGSGGKVEPATEDMAKLKEQLQKSIQTSSIWKR